MIDSQGRLMLADEGLAAVIRVTGIRRELLFLSAYLASLLLIWIGLTAIGRRLFPSAWLTIAAVAAFTLRHRIPRTSANSFEPYFHPRMLAFGIGTLAIAAVLRRRMWPAVALVGVSALVHSTTALWFAILIGVAIVRLDRTFRPLALGGAVAATALVAWAAIAGPLRGSFATMDADWLSALAGKDSLFASAWPAWAWAMNLSLIAIAWFAYRVRPQPDPALGALLSGAAALVAVFLGTLPLVLGKMAFPVQLQISRVFWLVDFVALLCLIAALRSVRAGKIVAALVVAVAVGRGLYVMAVEHPERPLFAISLPASDWQTAMEWIRRQPLDVHVLADPGHAWKYGTSVRVAADRDVFVEEVKDSAIAIYSREVALRYNERMRVLGDFGELTAERASTLASQYDLTYLVTEADLTLPLAYRNGRFKVYSLQQ